MFLRTGDYPDGTLGEIFIDMHKEGAPFRAMANCLAMSVSVGLQQGVPLAKYVDLFTFTSFDPRGLVTGHPHVKMASSIVDFVFRVLGIEYLQRYDLAQVQPDTEAPVEAPPATNGDTPLCASCGHVTVRSGTCAKCPNCGTSAGCS